MTTINYTIETSTIATDKAPKPLSSVMKVKKRLWHKIKQLNPLNWYNSFSDIEINMEEFSPKKSTQKIN